MSNHIKALSKRILEAEDLGELCLCDEKEGYYVSACKLSAEDIPGLLEIASQYENRNWIDSLDPEDIADEHAAMLPVIAWRCLADLKDPQAIEPLVKILSEFTDQYDCWISEDLPNSLGRFGQTAISPLQRLLEDTMQPTFRRMAASDALCEIAKEYVETRITVIDIFRNLLKNAETTDIELNSFTVCHLLDLNGIEAAEEIERAFAANRIDVAFAGDWDNVRHDLGIQGLGLQMPDNPIRGAYLDDDEYDDDDEYYDDKVTKAWLDGFLKSPEGQDVGEKLGGVNWLYTLFDYFRDYSDETIDSADSDDVSRFLLSYCPRKVSMEPEGAEDIIFELKKFFEFADRKLEFQHSKEILTFLQDSNLVEELKQELADPRNYGMAKSLVMGGMQAGFNMTTQEGMDAFMAYYNLNRLQQLAAEQTDEPHEDNSWAPPTAPIRVEKIGRNDPCPCGSGKKHKKCCLRGKVV